MSEGTAAAPSAPTSAPASTPSAPSAPSAPSSAPKAPAVAANDNGKPAATAPAAPETPPEPRYKVRVRGEERELSMAELTKLAEKGGGAEAVFRESAELRKRLSSDPLSVIAELQGDKSQAGRALVRALLKDPDARSVLEQEIVEAYEYEGLPPDQRRHVDEQRDLREKARRAEEYERAQKEQQIEARTQQYQTHIASVFTKALTEAGVAVDEDSIGWMALYTERAIESRQQVTPAELAMRVKAKLSGGVERHIKSLDVEALAALLGDETLGKLRARDVERLKPKAVPVERVAPQRAPNGRFVSNDNGERPRKSTSAFFQRIRGER